MQPDEQWTFRVIVYPAETTSPCNACFDRPVAPDLAKLTGRGDTPMLAIADLFNQAHRATEQENEYALR